MLVQYMNLKNTGK